MEVGQPVWLYGHKEYAVPAEVVAVKGKTYDVSRSHHCWQVLSSLTTVAQR
jgi:hypothetical protein